MEASYDFDVVVVGAGPAGSAAALALAQEGKSVMLVERGVFAGSKGVTGGKFDASILSELGKDLAASAPLERPIDVHSRVSFAGEACEEVRESVSASDYSVVHARLDDYLAKAAEGSGAMLVCSMLVDGVLEEGGRVCGISVGGEQVSSRWVVAADGIKSRLAKGAGLCPPHLEGELLLGVKEVFELDPARIELQCGLEAGQGMECIMHGIGAGGFLYTNKASVSLGVLFSLPEASASGVSTHELMQSCKLKAPVSAWLEGASSVEYAAHLVVGDCTGKEVPVWRRPCKEGLLVAGDAAGFVVNNAGDIRGIELAIASGLAAARAICSSDDDEAVCAAYAAGLEAGVFARMEECAKGGDV